MDRNEKNKALAEMYTKWFKFLETKKDSFDFFGARYSNPHLLDVPYNWDSFKTCIMFIGEEPYGSWWKEGDEDDAAIDCRNIEGLQALYRGFLYSQIDGLGANSPEEYKHCRKKTPPFWEIIRRFDKDGVGIICNNGDKFCAYKDKNNEPQKTQALEAPERAALHENCAILREEIELLKPTHLVFLGWRKESLKSFLSESAIKKLAENEKTPIFFFRERILKCP